MKLALTLEADSVNVQAPPNMGRIVVDVDGIKLAELINKVAENGYSPAWWMNVTLLKHRQLLPALISCRKTIQ